MATINFPDSPVVDQVFTQGSRSWKWNGSFWAAVNISGSAIITQQDTAPSNPGVGDLWYDTANGVLLLYYSDDVGTPQWVDVAGSPVTSDAATVTYTPAGVGAVATDVETKLRESVSVKDFGAVGDGVTDDTVAIQAAIDSGLQIMFPDGDYIVSSQLNITTQGQHIYGLIEQPNAFSGATIKFSHNGFCLYASVDQVSITNLGFEGTKAGSDCAIVGEKAINTDDIDLRVVGCRFSSLSKGIKCVGRALRSIENLFVSTTTCMELTWPISGTSGTGEQALPLGWRATRIVNNRAHSCGKLVDVTGSDIDNFRGAVISNNQMDIGESLLTGGIINSTISNNVVEMANSTIIDITGGGTNLTITGNILHGTVGNAAQSPAYAIRFNTGANPSDTIISSNSIQAIDIDGIRVIPAANRLQIVGNVIDAVSQDVAGGACISFDTALSKASIIGNSFNPVNSTNCISAPGATLTDVTIIGNGHNAADTMIVGTPTDGGNNIIFEEGRVGIGSSASAPTRALNITDSDSLLMSITRTGSSGGVGVSYENTAGSFNLFHKPTGTNTGEVNPGTDNQLSLGNASTRWASINVNDISQSVTATGGVGSSGSGNQYVAVKIGGVTYKLLHDGTI